MKNYKLSLVKKIGLGVLLILFSINGYSQMGEWTWMNGNNYPNSTGNYGTQGIFAPGNTPPALYEACEWTDKQGNFWLFGGLDNVFLNQFSDLWKFNPQINQWAWIKGPGIPNQAGIYGTKGIPSINNNPGGRGWGVPTWVNNNGDLWLFGSIGYDINGNNGGLTDLWKYDIATNEWTWISGSDTSNNPGNYGIKGVSALTNNPPSRSETNASWTDDNNNLWLYGGFGGLPLFSDMWKYNISSNEWVWMTGSNLTNQPPVYGTIGVSDTANSPGARACYAKWKDSKGNFWLNGAGTYSDFYNDLWKFNPLLLEWTWMKGHDTAVSIGYQCDRALINYPAESSENRACWTMCDDNFVNLSAYGSQNYLWNYSVNSNEWTMISGGSVSNNMGSYGIKLLTNSTNFPPARMGSLGWKDRFDNLWMFGGLNRSNEYFNDMWMFVLDTNCVPGSVCNVELIIKTIPNIFTPNNDGYNDYFDIKVEHYKDYHLLIFDRWGQELFESFQSKHLWDGYDAAGIQVPDGTYYYLLNVNDLNGKAYSYKGFLTLIR